LETDLPPSLLDPLEDRQEQADELQEIGNRPAASCLGRRDNGPDPSSLSDYNFRHPVLGCRDLFWADRNQITCLQNLMSIRLSVF
jgi:hypothetical protein